MNKFVKQSVLFSATVFATLGAATLAAHADGKTINWTQTSDLMTLDPSQAADVASGQVISQAGQGLYRMGKNGKVELADAVSAKVSDDGKTWTFKLRDGLRWSNGDPVTAADYVYGWQRTVDPANQSTSASLMSNMVGATDLNSGKSTDFDTLGVKALDEQTLQVSLNAPEPILPQVLVGTAFYPQNKAFVEKAGSKFGTTAEETLSNGPFVVKGWTGSNKTYSLEKNPDYVDAKLVKPDEVTFQTVTDSTTGYNLYNSGKVDFTTLTATQVKTAKSNKNFRELKNARTQYMALNVTRSVLGDKNARQALQYAVNKEQMVSRVVTGSGTNSTTFTPKGVATDPKTGKDFTSAYATDYTTYNKVKAQKLWSKALKDAHKQSVKLTLLTDEDDLSKNQAQFLQSQLQELKGLKVTVKTEPKPARVKQMLSSDFDLVLTGWGGEYADPLSYLGLWTTGTKMDFGKWSNKAYDKAVSDAQTTDVQDKENRMADLGAADKVLQEDVPAVTLYYPASATLMNSKVKGVQVNTVGSMFDFTRAVKK